MDWRRLIPAAPAGTQATGISVNASQFYAPGGGLSITVYHTPKKQIKSGGGGSRKAPAKNNLTLGAYGLTTSQELATINTGIPILFGKRTATTGGINYNPLLIYSRFFSVGQYQWGRLGFVLGEGTLNLPTGVTRGIRFGTKALSAFEDRFYSAQFMTGATANNDPTYNNTVPFGAFGSNLNLGAAAQNLYTGLVTGAETRALSQTFFPNEAFGFTNEEPDCDDIYFTPSTAPTNKAFFNPIEAAITNTRSCLSTEFGLVSNLKQVAVDDVAPIGSRWITKNALDIFRSGNFQVAYTFIYTVVSIAEAIKQTNWAINVNGVLLQGDSAVSYYRDKAEKEGLRWFKQEKATFVNSNEFTVETLTVPRYSFFTDFTAQIADQTLVPLPGSYNKPFNDFTLETQTSIAGCTYPSVQELLYRGTTRMYFHIYARSATVPNDTWKQITETNRPFLSIGYTAADFFYSICVQPATFGTYEYKFVPVNINDAANLTNAHVLDGRTSLQSTVLPSGYRITFTGKTLSFPANPGIAFQPESSYGVGISYVNEIIEDNPKYPFMSTATLNVRGYKNLDSLDQLNIYLDNGVQIQTLENAVTEPSNQFPELAYYLLTYFPGAAAGAVSATQIDTASFLKAIKFCRAKGLFFDGVITAPRGAFEYISDIADYFLLRFGLQQGKYAFFSAVEDSSTQSTTASATQKVTSAMIMIDSFSLQYASLKDREDAIVIVSYRYQQQYVPGEKRTVTVAPNNYTGSNIVEFDLSDFCTSSTHAATYGKYVLAQRQVQTHTVRFTCFPGLIDLTPGRLFTLDLDFNTSLGRRYTNSNQYQVDVATYREDGMVEVEATYMPTTFSSLVFGNTYKVTL